MQMNDEINWVERWFDAYCLVTYQHKWNLSSICTCKHACMTFTLPYLSSQKMIWSQFLVFDIETSILANVVDEAMNAKHAVLSKVVLPAGESEHNKQGIDTDFKNTCYKLRHYSLVVLE